MSGAFEGRVAIVTGGASGIGRSVARMLAERGATPVVFDIDEQASAEVEVELKKLRPRARAMNVDVRDRAAVAAAVTEVARDEKKLDFMFNNAGITLMAEVLDYDWPAWSDIIETDLMGVVHGVAAAYPIMVAQGSGHIVNTASLAALLPTPWAASYAAAKCGVWGLSVALRAEAAAHGVKVSCVCPAAVSTPIVERARYINIDRKRAYEVVPGSRMTPDDCAKAIFKGVERNAAVITPGVASMLALVGRLAPGFTQGMMASVSNKLAALRTEYLRELGTK